MNTSLLVVSHYVYAKSQDGALYPGRIISKESENWYNVEFADYTSSTVNENDLIWLGFYRLPPDSWPKSPVILPVKPSSDNIETKSGKADELKVDGFAPRGPDSLKILKNSTKEWEHETAKCKNEKMTNFATTAYREGQRHMRSSVLRLNRKALSKEISQNHNEDSASSPTCLDTVDDVCWRYNERKEHHFSNPSGYSMSPHPPYDRHDPPYFNTPCLTPPSTPGSLPPPLFVCKPYDTADYGDMWSHMDTRDIGGGKRRRRDNMKKCRKVYGIDNRDLWCTQCKWKKACTRFQIRNYSERYF